MPEHIVHRYYDPTTGSFLTVDPDVRQTQEPYAYTGDNPVGATDPNGLAPKVGPPPACEMNIGNVECMPVPFTFDNPYVAQDILSAAFDAYPTKFKLPNGQVRELDGYNSMLQQGYEFKIGSQNLYKGGIEEEIEGDKQLLAAAPYVGIDNPVSHIMWQFWPSSSSGTQPTTSLVRAVVGAGMQCMIFWYDPKASSEPVVNEIPWKVVQTASVLGLLGGLGYAAWQVIKGLAGGGGPEPIPVP